MTYGRVVPIAEQEGCIFQLRAFQETHAVRPRAPSADVAAIESILAFAETRQAGARSALVRDLRLAHPGREADGRVPSHLVPRLLARAALLLREPDLGLRLAAMGDPRRHGLLDYLAATSPTLGAAWLQIGRYLSLWNEGVVIRATVKATEAALEIHPTSVVDEPEGLRQLLGLAGATLVLMGHRYAGRPVPPRCVELACERPADPGPWVAAFAAPVRFAVPLTRVVYSSSASEIAGVTSDAGLARILGRHADELLARLGDRTRWSGRARDAIAVQLRDGNVGIASVATAMAVSARTLQRRLREEGTTFEAALDETRFALATSYLRDPTLAVAEIAWLVGYAEIATFYRAFRRWTGSTPAVYRSRLT
jgi:AraC-like DNA-binding protein